VLASVVCSQHILARRRPETAYSLKSLILWGAPCGGYETGKKDIRCILVDAKKKKENGTGVDLEHVRIPLPCLRIGDGQ
jgi:hypothetical protein